MKSQINRGEVERELKRDFSLIQESLYSNYENYIQTGAAPSASVEIFKKIKDKTNALKTVVRAMANSGVKHAHQKFCVEFDYCKHKHNPVVDLCLHVAEIVIETSFGGDEFGADSSTGAVRLSIFMIKENILGEFCNC